MVNQENVVSDVLKMEKLYFKFINFNASGHEADSEGVANVFFKEKHDVDGAAITIDLSCKIEVTDIFVLELCLVGIFTANSIENDKIVPNAIAVMFPYLRAQVSLMTAQPNIPNISLKPININALLEEQKSRSETE